MEEAVTFQFLIKGKHGPLGLGLDVTNSAAATEKDLGGRDGGRGGGNGGYWRGAKEARAQTSIVASTTATRMVVGTSVMNGRTLGDLDGHCDEFVLWVGFEKVLMGTDG